MKTTDKNAKSIVDVAMNVVSEAKTIVNDRATIDFIWKTNDIGFVMINIVALSIDTLFLTILNIAETIDSAMLTS